jgi:hypothetical protein
MNIDDIILAIADVDVPAKTVPHVAIVIGGGPKAWVIRGGDYVSVTQASATAIPQDLRLVLAYSNASAFLETLDGTLSPPDAVRSGRLKATKGTLFSSEARALSATFRALKTGGHIARFLQQQQVSAGDVAAMVQRGTREEDLSPGRRLLTALRGENDERSRGHVGDGGGSRSRGRLEVSLPVDAVVDSPSEPTLYTINVVLDRRPRHQGTHHDHEEGGVIRNSNSSWNWSVRKRYSEFSSLRKHLLKTLLATPGLKCSTTGGVRTAVGAAAAAAAAAPPQLLSEVIQALPFPPRTYGALLSGLLQPAEAREFRCERR